MAARRNVARVPTFVGNAVGDCCSLMSDAGSIFKQLTILISNSVSTKYSFAYFVLTLMLCAAEADLENALLACMSY